MEDTIELTLVYRTKTDDAICVCETPADPDVWIPVSLIEEMGEIIWEDLERTITLTLPVWLAEEKEFV